MARPDDFDSLLAEAQAQPFIGWDFSWVAKRIITQPLPWNYPSLVAKRAHESPDLLDLDTGGGELLAGLAYRPQRTIATESYPPNVSVAARRLHPMNVQVVKVEGPLTTMCRQTIPRVICRFETVPFTWWSIVTRPLSQKTFGEFLPPKGIS